MENQKAKEFLDIYNELDGYMRKSLNADTGTGHTQLINILSGKDKHFYAYEQDLKSFADLRNAIVHNKYSKEADPIAEPHEIIIRKYNELKNQIINPPKALSVAVRDIFTASLQDKAIDIMKIMHQKVYTHIPITENDLFVGVFSENVILSYLTEKEMTFIDKDTLIKDFLDFLPLEKHLSETFEFISRNKLLVDVQEIFQNSFKERKRLMVVYITENGKQTEKLLGMITPWDMFGSKN